eukprot:COSAG06_NODE_50_length_28525_cov_88.227010_5_plen_202_part_00
MTLVLRVLPRTRVDEAHIGTYQRMEGDERMEGSHARRKGGREAGRWSGGEAGRQEGLPTGLVNQRRHLRRRMAVALQRHPGWVFNTARRRSLFCEYSQCLSPACLVCLVLIKGEWSKKTYYRKKKKKDAAEGCSSRMQWNDAVAGCSGRMQRQDAAERTHLRSNVISKEEIFANPSWLLAPSRTGPREGRRVPGGVSSSGS